MHNMILFGQFLSRNRPLSRFQQVYGRIYFVLENGLEIAGGGRLSDNISKKQPNRPKDVVVIIMFPCNESFYLYINRYPFSNLLHELS